MPDQVVPTNISSPIPLEIDRVFPGVSDRKGKELVKNRHKKKVRFEENKAKESSKRVSKRTKKARGTKKKLRKFIQLLSNRI